MKQTVQSGQSLITLLLFVIISVAITTGAIIIIFVNSRRTTEIVQGNATHAMAETGIENTILRLLRNPSYTGETMTINGGTVVTQVTGTGQPYFITATASLNTFQKIEQVVATRSSNIITITSWGEQ